MTADRLAAWGILRAEQTVAAARAAGLELACAATLLEKESYGGRNVWGSDPVQTGGTYVKGSEVTRAAYLAYKARRRELGAQGVGPCQLTWPGFQDQADARGGCWDPAVNMAVGFETLAGLIRAHGLRDGFRRYNGSGPAAERYATDALGKLAAWRDRLGSPSPTPRPTVEDDEMTPEQERLLREVHGKLHQLHPSRADWRLLGWSAPSAHRDDALGYAINADARAFEARELLQTLRAEVAELAERIERVQTGGGVDPAALLDALAERLRG